MDAARQVLVMLVTRKRAAARAVSRAKRENFHEAAVGLFEAKLIEASNSYEVARSIYQLTRGGAHALRSARSRVISMSQAREEFVTLEDGYTHWWPQGSPHGALTSWHLRTLADELDRRNKTWDAHMRRVFGG